MSVGLILNLLNELNKSILWEPLASIILFYSTSELKRGDINPTTVEKIFH